MEAEYNCRNVLVDCTDDMEDLGLLYYYKRNVFTFLFVLSTSACTFESY